MVIDGTRGPFAPAIPHHWSSHPTCPVSPGHGRQLGAVQSSSWPCLLLPPGEERNQLELGQSRGMAALGLLPPRQELFPLDTRPLPVPSPGTHLPARPLSPSAKR